MLRWGGPARPRYGGHLYGPFAQSSSSRRLLSCGSVTHAAAMAACDLLSSSRSSISRLRLRASCRNSGPSHGSFEAHAVAHLSHTLRNARPFLLCSPKNTFMAAVETYAGFMVGDDSLNALLESRHASLYPPSRRRRNTIHDLS